MESRYEGYFVDYGIVAEMGWNVGRFAVETERCCEKKALAPSVAMRAGVGWLLTKLAQAHAPSAVLHARPRECRVEEVASVEEHRAGLELIYKA